MSGGPNKKTGKIGGGKAGPGRPKGARGKVSQNARSVLGEKGGEVVRKVVAAALEGDMAAARALLQFILPKADRAIQIDLGEISTPHDVVQAYARLAEQLRSGHLTEADIAAGDRILAGWLKSFEVQNLGERLSAVEAQLLKNQDGRRR